MRNVLFRERVDRELDNELRAVFDIITQEQVRAGLDSMAAQRAAVLELGRVAVLKERVQDARAGARIERLLAELRHTLRRLLRAPAFTATAIATLAVGMGATIGIFSAVNAALFRPLPFPDQAEIYALGTSLADGRYSTGLLAPLEVTRLRQGAPSVLQAVFVQRSDGLVVAPDGTSLPAIVTNASRGFFDLLGAPMTLGRSFVDEEHHPGQPAMAVISSRLWHERFGGRPDVLGMPLRVTSGSATIVGVAAAGVDLPSGTDVWLNFRVNPESTGRGMTGYVRARPGVARERLEADLAGVMAGIAKENTLIGTGRRYTLTPLVDSIVGDLGPILILVLSGAAVLLLLGCVNVANLLLARSMSRSREIGVRAALGAPRGRIVLHLLTEGLMLSTAGAMAGLFVAWAGLRILQALGAVGLPRLGAVPFDWRVLVFTGATLAGTTVLIGLIPAARLAAVDIRSVLGGSSRSTTAGPGAARLRAGMVVAQIALAVALVSGAGWVVRSFSNLLSNRSGFEAEGRLVFDVPLMAADYASPSAANALYAELSARLERVPGVTSVSSASSFPLQAERDGTTYLNLAGDVYDVTNPMAARVRRVSRNFFSTIGASLLAGRTFTAEEEASSALDASLRPPERVVLVNRDFVNRYLRGADPAGVRFTIGVPVPSATPIFQIVGVVDDLRYVSLSQPAEPTIYVPLGQPTAPYRRTLVVSTSAKPPSHLVPAIRREVNGLSASIPADVRLVPDLVSASLSRQRLGLVLMGLFAVTALVLAAIGIYGVIAFASALRLREIATRMALGASSRQMFWMLMKQGRTLGLAGAVVGVGAAVALGRVAENRLYEVRSTDPVVLLVSTAVVAAITIAATAVPAWRAARIDAASQLRAD